MPLPPLQKQVVETVLAKFCDQRVPKEIRNELYLSFEIKGKNVTLFENRLHFRDETKWTQRKVAQFRFDESANCWSLYCADRNGKWHCYPLIAPTTKFGELVDEVEKDRNCIFWG